MQHILTHHAVQENKTWETLHSIVSHAVALQGSSFKTAHIKLYLVIPQQDAVFEKNLLLVAMNHQVAQQETYASEVVVAQKKEGLNSVAKDCGVQLLHFHGLLHGVHQIQWWFVGSLDMLGNVSEQYFYCSYKAININF